MSNDENFGCLNVGRTGWHIDGTFLSKPYAYSLMHIIKVPKSGFGQTAFLSSTQMIDLLKNEHLKKNSNSQSESKQRENDNINKNEKQNQSESKMENVNENENESLYSLWSRLYMIGLPPTYPVHPVIYKHPITKLPTMIIHLGMAKSFLEVEKGYQDKIDFSKIDLNTIIEKYCNQDKIVKIYDQIQTQCVLKSIALFIEKCKKQGLMYKHDYKKGDLLISDNLAVLHEAVPSTQDSIQKIGLRVMHRVSVGGEYGLSKF